MNTKTLSDTERDILWMRLTLETGMVRPQTRDEFIQLTEDKQADLFPPLDLELWQSDWTRNENWQVYLDQFEQEVIQEWERRSQNE